jgi:hypothetical protein
VALEKFMVTGELPIRDAETRESIQRGGVVTLDTDKTIISALLDSGAIKRGTSAPKAKD